jgi:hypothetical protein
VQRAVTESLASADALNALRYPAGSQGHVESYFLKANEPAGERALWLKATVLARPGEPACAEGWAIAFERRGQARAHVAVKHALPFADTRFDARGLGIAWRRADEQLELTPTSTRGRIRQAGQCIAWELRLAGQASPLRPLPFEALYAGRFPKSKLCTPYPELRLEGQVEVAGKVWPVEGWTGMQGHNWGRGHADRYAWCQVNLWEGGEPFVLEGFSARVRAGPVLLPLTTLVCVRHGGRAYDFNAPLQWLRNRGELQPRGWRFQARGAQASIEGEVEADTEDFVGLHYANPEGPPTYCLNSKLARARVRFQAAGGPVLTLRSKTAALELGTHDPEHGVRMYA